MDKHTNEDQLADNSESGTDLLPCPFCGNDVERNIEGDIDCPNCAYTFYDTSKNNTWWNSRVNNYTSERELNQLNEALDLKEFVYARLLKDYKKLQEELRVAYGTIEQLAVEENRNYRESYRISFLNKKGHK